MNLEQLLIYPLAKQVFDILCKGSLPGKEEPVFLLDEAIPFVEFLVTMAGPSDEQLAALHVIGQYVGYLKFVQKSERSAAKLRVLFERLIDSREESERKRLLKAATKAQSEFAAFSGENGKLSAPKQDEQKPKGTLSLQDLKPPTRVIR